MWNNGGPREISVTWLRVAKELLCSYHIENNFPSFPLSLPSLTVLPPLSLRRLRACSLSGLRRYQSWYCCTCSPARVWSPPCSTLLTERKQLSAMTGTIQVSPELIPAHLHSHRLSPFRHVSSPFLWLLDGEDEKPPLPPRSASTSTPPGPETPTERYKVYVRVHDDKM